MNSSQSRKLYGIKYENIKLEKILNKGNSYIERLG